MKNVFKNEQDNVILKSSFFGAIIGLLILILLLIVEALVLVGNGVKAQLCEILALLSLGIAQFWGGFFAAKKSKSKTVQVGALTGLIIYIVIAVFSVVLAEGSISSGTFIKLPVFVAMSTVGAIVTSFIGNKSKYV
ncbi:MAG: TIGR04086 family membrane protein [Clostridia bacterium]|nr:TIGR04086 family membrane protein [Clostridia bacterium]